MNESFQIDEIDKENNCLVGCRRRHVQYRHFIVLSIPLTAPLDACVENVTD